MHDYTVNDEEEKAPMWLIVVGVLSLITGLLLAMQVYSHAVETLETQKKQCQIELENTKVEYQMLMLKQEIFFINEDLEKPLPSLTLKEKFE